MSPFATLLATLCLFETITLPLAGEVRRSSLFGYTVGGEVLDIEEAAARPGEILAAAPPPPVAKGEPSREEPAPVTRRSAVEEPAPAPELLVTLDAFPPASENAANDEDDGELLASVPEPPADIFAADDFDPAEAIVRVCDACSGGQRHRRGGCVRCGGRLVRAWVNNREVTPGAPCRTDAERLGVVNALSDLFPDLNDRVRQGALTLFGLATRGASPAARTQALAQWQLARRNEAFRAEVDGASSARVRRIEQGWGAPG